MEVSCIIPAFNEEPTIKNIINIVKKIKDVKEIIVVDDGSKDSTAKIALSCGAKVIIHRNNKGKGSALKSGLKKAKYNYILFLDADIINIKTKAINKMINNLKKSDAVIGYFNPSCFQTFTDFIYIPLMKLFFPEVLDKIKKGYLSGQRAFRKKFIKKMHLEEGFGVETGMNIQMTFKNSYISYVNLGNVKFILKGYQRSMDGIAETILKYARNHKRIDNLKESSLFDVYRNIYSILRKEESRLNRQ